MLLLRFNLVGGVWCNNLGGAGTRALPVGCKDWRDSSESHSDSLPLAEYVLLKVFILYLLINYINIDIIYFRIHKNTCVSTKMYMDFHNQI